MWSLISGGVTSGYNYVSSYVAESYLGQGGAASRVELRPLRRPLLSDPDATAGSGMSAGQRQLAKYDPKSEHYEGTSSDRQAALDKAAAEAADDPEIELEDMGEWLEPYEPPEYVRGQVSALVFCTPGRVVWQRFPIPLYFCNYII